MAAKQKQVKAALIGCGAHGLGVHAPALAALAAELGDAIELTAACDLDEAKARQACERFGFANACTDVAAMIRDHAPTACILATPAEETAMQGAQLLVQGMPCLFELPIGGSLDEAMEMSEAAGEMNTPHAVMLNRRENPYLARAVRWAKQLGPIESIVCTLETPGEPDATYINATVVHAVDALAEVLGRMERFTAAAREGGATIDLPVAGGMKARIQIGFDAAARSETYEITGSNFRASATTESAAGPALQCWQGETMEVDIVGAADRPDLCDGAYQVIAAFLAALNAGKTPTPTIDDAVAAVDLTGQIVAELLQTAA